MELLVSNIEHGRIGLCLAIDEIDDDLRRLVEFLNETTRDEVGVTALQLSYARAGDVEILVPSTFGGEIAETKVRAARRTAHAWTVETFLDALEDEGDRAAAEHLMELSTAAEGPGRRSALWFGSHPGGSIHLHPGGVSHAPAWIWVNSYRQLTICGSWKFYSSVAGHSAYAKLARTLGQDHTGSAKGVPVASVDIDQLWPILVVCGHALDSANQTTQAQ